MSGVVGLDAPGTVCAMAHGCSRMVEGAGGFDMHHPWPQDTGGPATQEKVPLCPNHHRRQHALVHYLINCVGLGVEPAWEVLRRFNPAERTLAERAVTLWQGAGSPKVTGWPCPAARPL